MFRILLCVVAVLTGIAWLLSRTPIGTFGAAAGDHLVAEPAAGRHRDPAGNGLADAAIARAPDGHFYADAQVNGARLRLMVDTGATSIALTRADAQAAGVQVAPGDFTAAGRGAAGTLRLKRVVLDRVAIGPVAATDVDAVVAEDGLPVSLVGQSFLARVGHIEIDGDRMTLR